VYHYISNNLVKPSPTTQMCTGYWLCAYLHLWNNCILEWKIQ